MSSLPKPGLTPPSTWPWSAPPRGVTSTWTGIGCRLALADVYERTALAAR